MVDAILPPKTAAERDALVADLAELEASIAETEITLAEAYDRRDETRRVLGLPA